MDVSHILDNLNDDIEDLKNQKCIILSSEHI